VINEYLENIKLQFESYKEVADKTIMQLTEKDLYWKFNDIASIIIHLSENMWSRWTDFFDSDGEKEWRNRENEFVTQNLSYSELVEKWENGWICLPHKL